ncbi:MAG: isoprenoid biosynthesis glyoxalase ElbB [Pseudomonadota bacterium]
MVRVAVVLSGCGGKDGSEINESVLTLLALDQQGAQVTAFAPNRAQTVVKNHLTGEVVSETRNMQVEACRFVREGVRPLSEAHAQDFDALIVPGGYGAALNLSNFATAGAQAVMLPELNDLLCQFRDQKKPVGFICIAPHLIPMVYPKGARLTVGCDPDTSATLRSMGAETIDCGPQDIVVDPIHRIVSTPAYMVGKRISEVAMGITQLVTAVLTMAKNK